MYIVINGGGKVGEYLAQVLLNSGNEVVRELVYQKEE